MATYVISYYEEPDNQELVDIEYFDSYDCMERALRELKVFTANIAGERNLSTGSIGWGAWPGGAETDNSVYCGTCKSKMWSGLQESEEI